MCSEFKMAAPSPPPTHDFAPLWVTKWVDYSNVYGFGFQLSDRRVGMLYNDRSRMLLSTDTRWVEWK